jgi:hypothetical protein
MLRELLLLRQLLLVREVLRADELVALDNELGHNVLQLVHHTGHVRGAAAPSATTSDPPAETRCSGP